jgi:nucleoid-associated protein YgaU
MALLDFIKGAGKKLFGREASAEEKANAVYQHLQNFNLRTNDIKAVFDGDDTVTVQGQVDSMLERKRIVATIGNIEGVERVNDLIQVVDDNDNEVADDRVRYYEVQSGDTLSGIAAEVYGDASKYPQIFEANRPMLKDPDEIYPGQKLVIPAE